MFVTRLYLLVREEDVTGVSGTGTIGEVVEFSDGRCCLRWMTNPVRSTVLYDKIEDVEAIHGHNGRTYLRLLHEFHRES